jgi:transposase
VGYGPTLAAFAVYLMVVQFIPAHRVVALLESLTGTAPSVGFVHGMINRTAGLLNGVHQRIQTLITLAYAVSCDETPLRVGPKRPEAGKKKAERYLLVAATELYTHYLIGDRSLTTFKAFVVADLPGSVIVHDRYQNYDSTALGALIHQLCTAHLLRRRAGLPRHDVAGPDRRRAARADSPRQPRPRPGPAHDPRPGPRRAAHPVPQRHAGRAL